MGLKALFVSVSFGSVYNSIYDVKRLPAFGYVMHPDGVGPHKD